MTILKDKDYPNFKPAEYLTAIDSGYLNGGGFLKEGTIMKFIGDYEDRDSEIMHSYKGFRNQDELDYGAVPTEEKTIEKSMSTRQYIKLIEKEGRWFRLSTNAEIEKMGQWLKSGVAMNKGGMYNKGGLLANLNKTYSFKQLFK